MRKLSPARSLLFYLEELEYTEAALSADPLTTELAAPFHARIEEWNGVFQRERLARRAVVRAEAVVAVRNNLLDTLTKRFAAVVLAEAGGERKSSFFKRFFAEAPSDFIAQPLRAQCERTRDKLIPEVEKQPDDSPLKSFAARLRAHVKDALDALTARSKSRGENASAADDVSDWKEGVQKLRAVTYAELLKVAVEKNLSRDWVETFFRSEGADAVSAEEETSAPAPTPAPAPNDG
jgi:hypothetical protein